MTSCYARARMRRPRWSQIVTALPGSGFPRRSATHSPKQGAIMPANVLNSRVAIEAVRWSLPLEDEPLRPLFRSACLFHGVGSREAGRQLRLCPGSARACAA